MNPDGSAVPAERRATLDALGRASTARRMCWPRRRTSFGSCSITGSSGRRNAAGLSGTGAGAPERDGRSNDLPQKQVIPHKRLAHIRCYIWRGVERETGIEPV
jgi:hypothetical protein